jgi:hypothetical protein
MGVRVVADAGTIYTFETATYWEETGGKLLIWGTHGGAEVKVLETFDSWVSVAFME